MSVTVVVVVAPICFLYFSTFGFDVWFLCFLSYFVLCLFNLLLVLVLCLLLFCFCFTDVLFYILMLLLLQLMLLLLLLLLRPIFTYYAYFVSTSDFWFCFDFYFLMFFYFGSAFGFGCLSSLLFYFSFLFIVFVCSFFFCVFCYCCCFRCFIGVVPPLHPSFILPPPSANFSPVSFSILRFHLKKVRFPTRHQIHLFSKFSNSV